MKNTVSLTEGPISSTLWSLAWPMMLTIFFYTLYNIVDAYWVSKISPEAIAAVSISQISLFAMVSLGFGITAGSGVLLSMYIGAKEMMKAERILGQSFVLSALLGVVCTIIALVFRNEFLTLSGAVGAVFAPALEYYVVVSAGSLLLFIMMAIMFGFNAQGDTHGLTKLFAISTLVNAVLDPIMIFGWFGTPALGIAGAAYATLISQAIFIVMAIHSLMGEHRMIKFRFENLTFEWETTKKILDIGFPAALTQVIFPIGLAALTFILSLSFKEAGTIAFSLGSRVEFFAYLPAFGFGFAAMALIGQNIGARNIERVRESFRKALLYATGGAAALGVIAALFAHFIIGAFTSDPAVTAYASSYLWTVTLSYGFLAALLVEASAFQALGRSWPGFWLFILRVAVITLPFTYLCVVVFELPILSAWFVIIIGNVISSVVGYFWITRLLNTLTNTETPVSSGN